MTRCALLLFAALLAACSSKPAAELLPETAAGWRRTELRAIPAADAPEPIPQASIRSIAAGAYEGPGKLSVRVYHVAAPAIGLDFVQRWQAPANTDYFYDGPYVGVIRWEAARPPSLREFGAALRDHLRRR